MVQSYESGEHNKRLPEPEFEILPTEIQENIVWSTME